MIQGKGGKHEERFLRNDECENGNKARHTVSRIFHQFNSGRNCAGTDIIRTTLFIDAGGTDRNIANGNFLFCNQWHCPVADVRDFVIPVPRNRNLVATEKTQLKYVCQTAHYLFSIIYALIKMPQRGIFITLLR